MTQPILPSPRFPRETLLQVLNLVSGVQVVWSSLKRPLQGLRPGTENAWLIAGVQSYRSVGVDERRFSFNPSTGQNDVIVVGQREFTLVVRARSLNADILAFDLLERVRFRLRGTPAKSLMIPTIALVDFGPIVDLPDSTFTVGDVRRAMSEATLDVMMACIVSADPGEPGEGDWIQSVAPATAIPDGSGGVSGNG